MLTLMRALLIFCGTVLLTIAASAETKPPSPNADSIAAYDALLALVTPGQTMIDLGDMTVPVETARLWRDQLARTAAPRSASQTGINKWTGGNVFYQFNANVSAAHRTTTRDAMVEWASFANLTFTESVSANYIMINDVPGLGGGNSYVGMIGGVQQLNIGSTSWNRRTLVHELGHALGLIHEHQRSDRDTFVTIQAANISGGVNNGNFILIPTSTNNGTYDFLSVMHYSRNSLSINYPADTIVPKPGYTQFIDVMGNNPDRILSRADRDGIALMYGAGPALTTVVTNTKDAGPGSLRAAIYKAFDLATDTPGATPTITFQIPNTDPNFSGGVFTIRPSDLLTAPGSGTTIDATTQTAFTGNTNASGPEIVINGALQPSPEFYNPGIRLSQANVTVKGLIIQGFSTQGVLITAGATGNTVAGCYIGTNAAGTAAAANAFAGIEINGGATGNTIGGATAATRNVISGNSAQGVFIRGSGTTGNTVRGNYLGLNAAGTGALPNGFSGIEIGEGANGNTVGGAAAGAGNVLSGNTYQGIYINGTSGHVIAGNFIGLNATGTAAVANGTPATRSAGIYLSSGSANNVIGGTAAGAGNVVSGNTAQGVAIAGVGATGNVLTGNFIGTNPAGTASLPNDYSGVGIFSGATANTIGGSTAGAGNLISGNSSQGIYIANAGTNNNAVVGNLIGTNAAGSAALPNGFSGVEMSNRAQSNLVGGTTASSRNLISGNAYQGVYVNGTETTANRISGNYIGTNLAGTSAISNGYTGVDITGSATANIIGGTAPGAGNVISGNLARGATLTGVGTTGNVFTGNLIGLNAAGTAALPNAGAGIQIFGGAQGNTIGSTSGGRNFIAGNNGAGVTISGNPTSGNTIVGNSIGLALSGVAVPNTSEGIALFADGSGGTQGNFIGGSTPGAANLISGNAGPGVAVYNNGTTGNRISGNSITANGGLGIDIWGVGVTTNDVGDSDSGPSNLQNFPALTTAVLEVGTTINGTLDSTASTTFRIEFFANATADGEGQNFIGAISGTTNGSGSYTIAAVLPAIVPVGQRITATATDPAGNTSEFSANVTTTDTDGDGLPNAYETANGLSTIVMDAIVDSDGDGMTNAQEFRAGTNPQSGSSILRLGAPVTVGADKTLNLPSLLGRTYRIDFADDLLGANPWRTLADQIPGSGVALTITDPGAVALLRRFYRAVVLP